MKKAYIDVIRHSELQVRIFQQFQAMAAYYQQLLQLLQQQSIPIQFDPQRVSAEILRNIGLENTQRLIVHLQQDVQRLQQEQQRAAARAAAERSNQRVGNL